MHSKIRTLFAVSLVLAFVLTAALSPAAAAPRNAEKVPGQYIVVFKDSVADVEGKVNAIAAQHGLGVQRA
jgi:subtilisin